MKKGKAGNTRRAVSAKKAHPPKSAVRSLPDEPEFSLAKVMSQYAGRSTPGQVGQEIVNQLDRLPILHT